mgnify:CR=1 FL=1
MTSSISTRKCCLEAEKFGHVFARVTVRFLLWVTEFTNLVSKMGLGLIILRVCVRFRSDRSILYAYIISECKWLSETLP